MKAMLLTLFGAWLMGATSMYELKVNSIDGKMVDLSQFKGKTLLIVNTASKCGYTPQYADLQKLHDMYGKKVIILGFPANNFKGQEPGSNAEIAEFCTKEYGVTFQMFEKISVIGEDQHPLYAWLKEKTGQEPTWNFCKYIVKPDGSVKFFSQKVSPMAKEILDEI
ncbi:MAG: glutathione peroxidase [Cyclobacteriaceae bacterium]|nr:glutathione peroxidase [Cyclobacteriaceae bacterium]